MAPPTPPTTPPMILLEDDESPELPPSPLLSPFRPGASVAEAAATTVLDVATLLKVLLPLTETMVVSTSWVTLPVKLEGEGRVEVDRGTEVEKETELDASLKPTDEDGLLVKKDCDTDDGSNVVMADEKLLESPSVDGGLVGEMTVGEAVAVEGLPRELGGGLAPVANGTNCLMISLSMSMAPAHAAVDSRKICRKCMSGPDRGLWEEDGGDRLGQC